MLRRLLVGLLKGLAVGGAIGALLHFGLGVYDIASGINYLLYGAVVGLAGALAGQPPWRAGAWVGSLLKLLFGFGIGAGLYALGARFLALPVEGIAGLPAGSTLPHAPLLFAPLTAAVYGMLVELDDGGEQPAESKPTGVRVKGEAGAGSAAHDEVSVERESKSSPRARR
jgi:hypothetical protein